MAWTRCSVLELQRLNAQLKKENDDKNQELEQVKKYLDEAHAAKILAYNKTRDLEERVMDVRYQYIYK